MTEDKCVAKEGEVTNELNIVGKQANEINEIITRLRGRLVRILNSRPTPECEVMKEAPEDLSPMGLDLRAINKMQIKSIEDLQRIFQELEI